MKQNLVGKIFGKIKIFVQDLVPIRTALVLFWQNLSPRFSNGGCHENLDVARKSIAPLLSLRDKQLTQNAHGDNDAAIAKAAAALTHVQSLSQGVGSGDGGLGLFGVDLSSAETDFWWLVEEQSRKNRNQYTASTWGHGFRRSWRI